MRRDRRDFLRAVAGTGALARGGRGTAAAPHAVPQPANFHGTRPGQARVVEQLPVCWCPAGRFRMGSAPTERGHRTDEQQVEVTLTAGFWTGTHEVTQGEWTRVMGRYPDAPPSPNFGEGSDVPVYWINFDEAEAFCTALTARGHRSGELPGTWAFSLPTEAQWEYACRAGTTTATAFGDVLDLQHANFNVEPVDRVRGARGSARPVGSYPANGWGLHDMHGNVWEWCRDWYHERLPGGIDPDLSRVQGVPNPDGTYSRVRRGGAWPEPEWACRSACRLRYEPPRRSDHIGMRVVIVPRT